MKNSLGPLECQVMKIIWKHSCASVCLVIKELKVEKELAYTTVMTIMSRLVEKHVLRRSKQGKSYIYTPVQTRKEFIASVIQQTVLELVDKFGEEAVTALVDSVARVKYRYTTIADCIPQKNRKIV